MPSELLVTAAVLVLGDGRILLARRAARRSQGGLWEFPGGKVEPGEAPPESLVRELREELALDVEAGVLAADVPGVLPSGGPLRLLAYRVRPRPPLPSWVSSGSDLSEADCAALGFPDHDRVAWVPPGDLPAYSMPPVDEGVVQALHRTPGPGRE